MALLIDLSSLSPGLSNQALEFIYKAHHGNGNGIWNPHESPLIRRLIELFSQRGLDRLAAVREQLIAWENGDHFNGGQPPPKAPPGMMQHWNAAEIELVKLYLESLPPAKWTIDDHMMTVEYVIQQYMPVDLSKTEAEWLAVRSTLMGKVQANLDAKQADDVSLTKVDELVAEMPTTVAAAVRQYTLNARQEAVLRFGTARAVENVVALTDRVRHQMRDTVMRHAKEQMLGAPSAPAHSLETTLFDQFADLNRDWRRIAVTEAGECQTQGFIASLPVGAVVKRVEQYEDACAFCRKIHGRKATVVSPDAPDKDGDTQIWTGKDNVGRSASPRKRVDGQLVARTKEEMYWLPAGLSHPHCRGRWVLVSNPDDAQEGDDPEFAATLRDIFS